MTGARVSSPQTTHFVTARIGVQFEPVNCSPHPRGWSRRPHCEEERAALLPAPAGVTPAGLLLHPQGCSPPNALRSHVLVQRLRGEQSQVLGPVAPFRLRHGGGGRISAATQLGELGTAQPAEAVLKGRTGQDDPATALTAGPARRGPPAHAGLAARPRPRRSPAGARSPGKLRTGRARCRGWGTAPAQGAERAGVRRTGRQ